MQFANSLAFERVLYGRRNTWAPENTAHILTMSNWSTRARRRYRAYVIDVLQLIADNSIECRLRERTYFVNLFRCIFGFATAAQDCCCQPMENRRSHIRATESTFVISVLCMSPTPPPSSLKRDTRMHVRVRGTDEFRLSFSFFPSSLHVIPNSRIEIQTWQNTATNTVTYLH